jgi:hypothetical protein
MSVDLKLPTVEKLCKIIPSLNNDQIEEIMTECRKTLENNKNKNEELQIIKTCRKKYSKNDQLTTLISRFKIKSCTFNESDNPPCFEFEISFCNKGCECNNVTCTHLEIFNGHSYDNCDYAEHEIKYRIIVPITNTKKSKRILCDSRNDTGMTELTFNKIDIDVLSHISRELGLSDQTRDELSSFLIDVLSQLLV